MANTPQNRGSMNRAVRSLAFPIVALIGGIGAAAVIFEGHHAQTRDLKAQASPAAREIRERHPNNGWSVQVERGNRLSFTLYPEHNVDGPGRRCSIQFDPESFRSNGGISETPEKLRLLPGAKTTCER